MMSDPCLQIQDLRKYYEVKTGLVKVVSTTVKAVDGVNLTINRGETLGLVGESGCGKTTLARIILKVTQPTSGKLFFNGRDITHLNPEETLELRKNIQMVFQNPYSSLNPRMTIKDIVAEPLVVHTELRGSDLKQKVVELLEMVGLSEQFMNRFPHQFSGGQRQRIAIARAIATAPALLILDEPTSALDVSVQAQILLLLQDLQKKFNMTYLFISHNLSIVKYMSQEIATMYKGKIVEFADSTDLFKEPLHPYTRALLASIPLATKGKTVSVAYRPETESAAQSRAILGCNYQNRCPHAMEICKQQEPPLLEASPNHEVACYLYPKQKAAVAESS